MEDFVPIDAAPAGSYGAAPAGSYGAVAAGTPAANPSAAPSGWYADPHQAGGLRWFDGQVWTAHTAPIPGHAGYAQPAGYPPAGYGWAGGYPPPPRDRTLEYLLPVNRSGLAIAAGYAGLFSILLIFAPIAIVLGGLALRDLSTKPDVGGRGRAWFGIIAGTLGTIGLIAVGMH